MAISALIACRTREPPTTASSVELRTGETGVLSTDSSNGSVATGDSATTEERWLIGAESASMRFVDLPPGTGEDQGVGQGFALLDTDLDGQMEVVLTGKYDLWVWKVIGKSGQHDITTADMRIPKRGGLGVLTADFNGDGNEDLLTFPLALPYQAKVELLFTPLAAGASATLLAPGTLVRPVSADIDGDGFTDVVHAEGSSLQLFFGPFLDGEVRSPDRLMEWHGPETFGIDFLRPMGDLTGDGYDDFIVKSGTRVHLWPGPVLRDGPERTQGVFRLVDGNAGGDIPLFFPTLGAGERQGVLLAGGGVDGEFGLQLVPAPIQDAMWTEAATLVEPSGHRITTPGTAIDANEDEVTDWAFSSAYPINGLGVALGPFEGSVAPTEQLVLHLEADWIGAPWTAVDDVDHNGQLDYLLGKAGNTLLYMNPPMRTAEEIR